MAKALDTFLARIIKWTSVAGLVGTVVYIDALNAPLSAL